jgi:hypothetical protein
MERMVQLGLQEQQTPEGATVKKFVEVHGGPALNDRGYMLCRDGGAYRYQDVLGLTLYEPPAGKVERMMLQLKWAKLYLAPVLAAIRDWGRPQIAGRIYESNPKWDAAALGEQPEPGGELKRLQVLKAEREMAVMRLASELATIAPHLNLSDVYSPLA